MGRILVLSDDRNISDALAAAGHEVCFADGKENFGDYDLVLAPPSYFSVPSVSGSSSDYEERLCMLFNMNSDKLEAYISELKSEIYNAVENSAQAKRIIDGICAKVIEKVFTDNEWMELYFAQEDFIRSSDTAAELIRLHSEFGELFPIDGGDEERMILYILNNPESDIKQKTLASKMYMNSSYISTVFAAKTGIRFVDYLTAVKLKRAAYLLINSDLRISEIAARLDYKDIGYFSRIFKSRYGMPPSEYRMPKDYIYVI